MCKNDIPRQPKGGKGRIKERRKKKGGGKLRLHPNKQHDVV